LQQRAAGGDASDALQQAIENLQQAEQSLERSARSDQPDTQSRQEAANALQRAADALERSANNYLQQDLASSRRDVDHLIRDQQTTIERLEQLERESLAASRRGAHDSMQNFEMAPFAQRKRRMQSDLNEVRGDLAELGDAIGTRNPDVQQIIERALDDLSRARVDERLAASADAFEMGRPLFALGNEEQTVWRWLRLS
jgi:hypothetical protein